MNTFDYCFRNQVCLCQEILLIFSDWHFQAILKFTFLPYCYVRGKPEPLREVEHFRLVPKTKSSVLYAFHIHRKCGYVLALQP